MDLTEYKKRLKNGRYPKRVGALRAAGKVTDKPELARKAALRKFGDK